MCGSYVSCVSGSCSVSVSCVSGPCRRVSVSCVSVSVYPFLVFRGRAGVGVGQCRGTGGESPGVGVEKFFRPIGGLSGKFRYHFVDFVDENVCSIAEKA